MRAIVCGLAAFGLAATTLALPVRREVVGLSMAPGIMPGDRVASGPFPWADRWRLPRRGERWTLEAPDGTPAVKRIAAIGPATVRIVDGDLEIGGMVEPPPPSELVQRATVAQATSRPGRAWRLEGVSLLDEATFAPQERRVLLPVRDAGVCVVVRSDRPAPASPVNRLVIGIDGRAVAWTPSGVGRFVILAGRLDRRLVAAAWRLGDSQSTHEPAPARLPAEAPAAWGLETPWQASSGDASSIVGSPALAVRAEGEAIRPEQIVVWRDVLHRPAANGISEWTLGQNELFVLGDFPSGSVDSRQWGPLAARVLRTRLATVERP